MTNNPTDKPLALVTPQEAAYLLQKDVSTIYALIKSGAIPAKMVGGRWAIPRKWLEALEEIDNRH